MKKKILAMESNILGRHIKEARKNAGMSQQELGKRIGLGKSSISKIESGKTNISFEEASILMEVMGSKLNVTLEMEEHSYKTQSQVLHFSRECVLWFSEFKGVSVAEAFKIMLKNKALTFLKDNYRYESTLPKDVIIEDIDNIVNRNIMSQV